MGGIAGIIRFDQQTVSPDQLVAMSDILAHRGNAVHQTVDNGVLMAFGGGVDEYQPASVWAVADATVFEEGPLNQLLTDAYLTQNLSAFNGLNADFAVAIYDARQRTVSCVRDPLGVKPLYYTHVPGRFFAFASEIKALLTLPDVPTVPNEAKFREYLTWPTDYVPYSAETFYRHIYSVLPGYAIRVNTHSVETVPYWTPNPAVLDGLLAPDDYAALFQERFTTAIDRRMRGRERVGAHLSGGLDSSSVSCVAQQLLRKQQRPALHTFNIDTRQPEADEQNYAQAVVEQWQTQHQRVTPLPDVLASVLEINRLFDRPEQFIIPSSFHLSVSQSARQVGCDLLLTGHDGDSVIPTGFDYIDQLLDASEWAQLEQACHQFVSFHERDLTAVRPDWFTLNDRARYEAYVLSVLGGAVKKRFRVQSVLAFGVTLKTLQTHLRLSAGAIAAYVVRRIHRKITHQRVVNQLFTPDFQHRFAPTPASTTGERSAALSAEFGVPISQIINTTNVICNEQLNHIGAYYGHEYSFPFFDRNVLELGLFTPLSVHFSNGHGRGLIRHGLRHVLPPIVAARVSKANFIGYSTQAAQQLYNAAYEQFSAPSHPIWAVIDPGAFAQIKAVVFNDKYPIRRKTRYNWLLSRTIYAALWLNSLR
ncbi:asparagine synthetase B family protein [Spirosoma montaniterrae]|uniref:asparagine synthase (glutamine-hydrolyzing) n=1 Tax=Spirosoma montaniterrae TaxID=1178516 RepID=A0A1P9WS90_9BACT|nr:asparagine synthetase B [Spirosoma montaniterrae]AQG78237.1 asparagine synthase [Spirosoma montaniterrae]